MASKLRHVKYVGPFDAVEIEHPVGGKLRVERGDVVRLPARLAVPLCRQKDNWVEVEKETGDAA